MSSRQDLQQRVLVAKLSREDLEDQHLRTLEDMNILKTHARKQEEKIKKMATKLIRLANDRKKLAALGGTARRSAREVDLEESIEKLEETNFQLNKDKDVLKQKLRSANQQLLAQGKRPSAYPNVASRIDSGVAKTQTVDQKFGNKSASQQQNRYGRSLLDEARGVNEGLRRQILALQEQIARNEDENTFLKHKLDAANAMHEEEILLLRQHESNKEKSTLDGNVELIRVQRQLKEKLNDVGMLESRYNDLQTSYQKLMRNHEELLRETEGLKSRLLTEERKSFMAEASLNKVDHKNKVSYLEANVKDLEAEVKILKDANERLTESAFDQEKEMKWRQLERDLRLQIAQLEAAMKLDINDRNDLLSKMQSTKGYSNDLYQQSRKAKSQLDRLREENEDLRDRLKIYTLSGDEVNVEELRDALAVIRKRRHDREQKARPAFLENIESKDLETEFAELQANHVDTIQELEKTREMLIMQYKINKDYQIELESVTNQMHEMRAEYESKLDRYARLLDARAARIQKVEHQLHDVAYGTKQFKIDTDRLELEDDSLLDDTVKLERGENILEINVTKVTLSAEARTLLTDKDASLFVTYAFYDFDMVSTSIQKSTKLIFDFTAQFTLKVNDTFLHYLQKEGTLFELHQAMGIDHRTIASCKVRFNDLLDRPQGKLRASATLIGLNGINCGSMDFWVRLRVPMDQAIRLYRERVKALGYLSANIATTKKTFEEMDNEFAKQDDESLNQLLVQILSCNHVQGKQPDVQPNVYCVYKFFDFADHDTIIIPSTNNPTFDDRQAYPVHMNADLDAYLKSEKLQVYVFDDTDPDMSSYLGKAEIDLIPLAHNKPICAPFELKMHNGEKNGSIEFAARWQLAYNPPSGVLREEPLLEEEAQEMTPIIKKPPTPKKTSKPSRSTNPTPIQRKPTFSSIYQSPNRESNDVIKQPAERDEQLSDTGRTTTEPKKLSFADDVEVSTDDVTQKADFKSVTSDRDYDTSSLKRSRKVQFEDETPPQTSSLSAKELSGTSKLITIEEPELPEEEEEPPTSPKEDEEKSDDLEDFISDVDDVSASPKAPSPREETAPRVPLEPKVLVVQPPAPKTLPRTKTARESTPSPEEDLAGSLPESEEEEESIPEMMDSAVTDELAGVVEDLKTESPPATGNKIETLQDETQSMKTDQTSGSIRIRINHLTLDPSTSVWGDEEVEQMFVEFDFLGSVEETPEALPKPKSKHEKIFYNFETSLELDASDHVERREALSSMMTSGHTSFKMTVVSEPVADDEDADCTEIGTASVDLNSILMSGRDIINDDVVVTDLREPGAVVGKLNISIEALSVLQMIKKELKARLAESD